MQGLVGLHEVSLSWTSSRVPAVRPFPPESQRANFAQGPLSATGREDELAAIEEKAVWAEAGGVEINRSPKERKLASVALVEAKTTAPVQGCCNER